MEDERIVDLYLARDEDAIRETDLKYGKKLFFFCKKILTEERDAEETKNDVYFETWNTIPPHEPRNYFYAFILRIARHKCLDRCKYRSRKGRVAAYAELSAEMEECIPSPDDLDAKLDDLAIKNALDGFIESLDREKRYVFIRRYWYLDPVPTIAGQLGVREGKIRMILLRTRERLRAYLKKEGIEL